MEKKQLKEVTDTPTERYIFYRREKRLLVESKNTLKEYRGDEAIKIWNSVN